VLENVNITVKDFAAGAKSPFSFAGKLGKGDVKLDGTAGPVNPADASQTPVQMNVKITGLDLNESGVSGIVTVDGAASVEGTTLAWKGLIHVEQAKLVPRGKAATQAVEFSSTVQHNLKDHSGVVTQGDVHLGSASASLTGSYAAQLNLHLKGSAMPVSALEAMMPSLNIELPAGSKLEGGTAAIDATVTGSAAAPVVDGTLALTDTKLTGFDLGTQVAALERLSGIQPAHDTAIQTLSTSLRSDTEGTAIQTLKLDAPAIGELNGAGTISPRHALDLKMTIMLRSGLMNVALGRKTAVPFFVRGTAAHPSFEPGIAAAEINRLGNVGKTGGVDAGKLLNGIFGRKK
jgi:AsmA protein